MDEKTLEPKLMPVGGGSPALRVAILQPSYLPWLGYFDQMDRADTFIFLDDVQFTRRDWRNRNKVRTREGWAWMTVPVIQKHRYRQSLKETRIDPSLPWQRKHLETLRASYGRCPFFDLYFPYLNKIYNKDWDFLVDLCLETTGWLKEVLGISTPTLISSAMPAESAKAEKILWLCRKIGATHYLSGDAGKNYISPGEFSNNGVVVEFQNYRHPVYAQRFPGFVPYLSVIDLLFNMGEQSLGILRQPYRENGACPARAG
ncbi:MAG: WbqC family protein [Nitrospinaceae bacterium]